jgi:hypothetical protein
MKLDKWLRQMQIVLVKDVVKSERSPEVGKSEGPEEKQV